MERPELDVGRVRALLGGDALGRVEVLDTVGSTSVALQDEVLADPAAWPDRSLVVAEHQTAGRGRAERTWTTPRGVAVTASVLLRPDVPAGRLGWLPLIGGLATALALRDLGAPAVLKWPNDVLLPAADALPGWGVHRKVAGILATVVPGSTRPGRPRAVVLGIGINVAQRADEVPVPSATSLAVQGLDVAREDVLAAVLARLLALDTAWRAADGDGPAEEWSALSVTVGAQVSVTAPGAGQVHGRAVGLGPDGALLVEHGGRVTAVLAGDVHVRAT